jgi:hypothetical protein
MEVLASVIGWGVLLLLGAVALRALWRRSRAAGILAPVLVGLALRLVVMVMAHLGSLSLGDHGILFLDDQTYYHGASVLTGYLDDGQLMNPARYDVLGTYQAGYQFLLVGLFTLGTPSVLLGKLVNVLLGTATILLVALIGERLLGRHATRRVAWLTALAPTLVWWSAPMLKEALATFLVALGMLAAMSLPRRRALVSFAAVAGYLMIVRGPAALALVVGAGLALLVAGKQAEGRWWSRPLRVYVLTLAGSVLVVALVISRGDLNAFYMQYDHVVHNMIRQYQGGNPLRIPYDAVKSLLTPLPWAFDRSTQNWDRGLYPGMWLLFCALPLAMRGLWRFRGRAELWLLVGTAVTAVGINAFTSGFVFRQRSMVEPIILLLALGGASSWRMAARWSAATLAVTAVGAGIQSRSPVVVLAIAAAAGALFLLSRRLPADAFEEPPESGLVARLRLGPKPRPRDVHPRARVAAMRAVVLRIGPRLRTEHTAARTSERRGGFTARSLIRRFAPRLDRVIEPRRPDRQEG